MKEAIEMFGRGSGGAFGWGQRQHDETWDVVKHDVDGVPHKTATVASKAAARQWLRDVAMATRIDEYNGPGQHCEETRP